MLIEVNEQKVAQQIIRQGLDDAAKSMEFFTMSETRQEFDENFVIGKTGPLNLMSYENKIIYLLTTGLEGELNGKAFLILTEEEVNALMKIRYDSKKTYSQTYEARRDGLILEIDNIITASVMSQFANHFDYNTYGGTPNLDILTYRGLVDSFETERTNNEFTLEFKARLVSEGVNINANFVWFVDEKFINGIKKATYNSALV
ncbi:MAG: hypothetical protein ACFHWX_01645 [Bacteroidota bacterium]